MRQVLNKGAVVITPISLLERFSSRHHLVLPQYYLKYPEYADFYRKRREEGDFIILDNGAAELRRSLFVDDIIRVAKNLRPNIVVAPDTIYGMHTTIQSTMEFMSAHYMTLRGLGIEVMAVPQGADEKQWDDCYRLFNEDPSIKYLGISMFYTPVFKRRAEVLKAIAPTIRKPCHLLGVWNNPYELLEERQYDFVTSVDTAKAIEFAIEGLSLKEWARHQHIDDDWYFETTVESISTLELAERNVVEYVKIFLEGEGAT